MSDPVILVYGASGWIGQLVVEELQKQVGTAFQLTRGGRPMRPASDALCIILDAKSLSDYACLVLLAIVVRRSLPVDRRHQRQPPVLRRWACSCQSRCRYWLRLSVRDNLFLVATHCARGQAALAAVRGLRSRVHGPA
jgi:hypothetical protein